MFSHTVQHNINVMFYVIRTTIMYLILLYYSIPLHILNK